MGMTVLSTYESKYDYYYGLVPPENHSLMESFQYIANSNHNWGISQCTATFVLAIVYKDIAVPWPQNGLIVNQE